MTAVSDAIAAAGIAMALKEIYDGYMSCVDAADEYEYAMAKVSTVADDSVSISEQAAGLQALAEETGTAAADRLAAQWENFTVAIGDEFAPELENLREISADILDDAETFVEDNPALIKAGTAFVAVVGTATVGLTAYAAIVKIIKVLDVATLFTGPASGVLMIAAGAAVAATALIALTTAADDTTEIFGALTPEAERQQEEIQDLQAQYDDVCESMGETSTEAQLLADKIEDLSDTYDAGYTTVGAFYEAMVAAQEAYDTAISEYNDTTAEITDQYESVDSLAGSLYDLANQTSLTAAEQAEMETIVAMLNDSVDGLNLAYDDTTDSLNLTADAILEVAKAAQLAAQYEEDVATLETLITGQTAAEDVLATATANYDAAKQVYDGAYDTWASAWNTYDANLDTLQGRDVAGLDELVAAYADGSEDSASYIAAMAWATDDELATMVEAYQNLQAAQGDTADDLADLETDYSDTMDALETRLDELESNLDLADASYQAAKDMLVAYASGLTDNADLVSNAYSDILSQAITAIDTAEAASDTSVDWKTINAVTVPAHAEGAVDAESAYIAGDAGPELIIGAQGSTVFPAKLTSAILGGSSAGYQVTLTVAPQFTLNGSAGAADINEAVRQNTDYIKELALDAMNEAGIDTRRVSYI